MTAEADSAPARKTKRPLIFLTVGAANTLLDFGFYTALTQAIFRGEQHIAAAGMLSGTFALLCAFLTHSLITWRGSRVSHHTILKFVAFTGSGMWVIRPLLLSLFIHMDGLYRWAHGLSKSLQLPFSHDFIASTGAFGFMVVIVLIYNYLVYSRFVFNERHPARTDQGNRSAS